MPSMSVGDVSLFFETRGSGYPLVLMHGGPGTDHLTLLQFRPLADQFTLVFYDHRCNGRSVGAPVESMTWDNLTSDADALRQQLGFERWAVLGHSFGGYVALEYALRYPQRVSHLVLLDTGSDSHWARENAPEVLKQRGYSAEKVELVRRWFSGEFEPEQMFSIFIRIAGAYQYHSSLWQIARTLLAGSWRSKFRGDALVFAGRQLLKNWTVVDRLAGIAPPTLVMAGRQDFIFPPESQDALASAIPNAQLQLIDHAGHNPHMEQTAEVMSAVREFVGAPVRHLRPRLPAPSAP